MIRLSPGSPRENGAGPARHSRLTSGCRVPGGKRGGTAVRPRGSGRVVLAPHHRHDEDLPMALSPRPTHPGRPPGYPRTGHTDVPAQPDFPALEREVLDYW